MKIAESNIENNNKAGKEKESEQRQKTETCGHYRCTSSPRVAHVSGRKESSRWKTMALDRHTIASLEGPHYQYIGDREEISERTHSNDGHRGRLPTH